jgi:membrane associated rhomboid family serine protease
MSSSGAAPAPGASQPSRFSEFIAGTPLITLTLLIINIVVYIASILGDYSEFISYTAIMPALVIEYYQFWRIVSAAFCHG